MADHKKKLITAATVVRAITTVAVVAIPVMAITTTIVGYGAYKIFKGLRKKKIVKVYFAHPCFNAEQEEFKALFLKRISAALSHRSDIHIIDPFGHTPNIEDDTEAKLKMAKDIKTGCIRLLEECDIVIALADGSDTGTAFEAGYAHARGKPVILISRMGCAAANAMLIGSAVMMIDDVLGEGRMEELAGYLERYDATTGEHLLSPESA